MTDAPQTRGGWRLTRQSVVAFVVALAVGLGIGVLVDIISPNPVYGLQIEADGLAILIVLVVAVVPPARRFLPAALGLAVGVIAGVAIGMAATAQPSAAVAGDVKVQLGKPEAATESAAASCLVLDGHLVSLVTPDEGALRLADGRFFSVSIGAGEQEPVAVDRPLDIVVVIRSTLPDGSPTETRMTSDASSTISISNAGATGSMAFQRLVLHHQSELRVPIDVAGSVTWDCLP